MGHHVPERVITLLCGKPVVESGNALVQENKVKLVRQEETAEPDEIVSRTAYKAAVQGRSLYTVTADIDSDGDVQAGCTCPAYKHGGPFCKHIAAVLIHVHRLAIAPPDEPEAAVSGTQGHAGLQDGVTAPRRFEPSARSAAHDSRLVDSLLGMFAGPPVRPSGAGTYVDTRQPLSVEWTVKPFATGLRGPEMLGIEVKLGPKRLYVVQNIRGLLNAVWRGEALEFSRQFQYSPVVHSFGKQDNDVMLKLIQIVQNEKIYRETSGLPIHTGGHYGGDRLLMIPPYFWEELQPLLIAAPTVQIQQDNRLFAEFDVLESFPPLTFELDQGDDSSGYHLNVTGLEKIKVLEDYSLLLSDGKLLKLQSQDAARLAGLKTMLKGSNDDSLKIAAEQIEPFMDKVVPGLLKLGNVDIAETIKDKIHHHPLQARLYLDRIRDRLLAGIEFQYGDIIFNPLESQPRHEPQIILLRDSEHEEQILALMEHAAFTQTESGFVMNDEDSEYDFLYHKVPLLEELLSVYATTAVKERLLIGNSPPKVSLRWNEKTDWLDFTFDLGGIPEAEISELVKSLQEKRRYYRLPNGALLPLETEAFQEIITFMNEIGVPIGAIQGKTFSLPLNRGLHLIPAEQKGDAVKLDTSFRKLLLNLHQPDRLDFPVPDSLVPVLRDYQQLGYQWLKTLAHYRFGGILADDMGLGKTLQSIAFLLSELPSIRESGYPALIVAPASLLYNWLHELTNFAPDIRAVIADGTLPARTRTLRNKTRADVIITSYPLIRRDVQLYAGKSFHTLILDEAQFIKNETTQSAQAVRSIKARYRFALTGTPVENALEDLWSIFGVVFPGLFPDSKKTFHDLPREAVAKRARPFLLRRLKGDVLKELPDKIETLQRSELLPEQKKLYAAYLAKLQKEALKHLDSDGFGGFGEHRITIFAGLTRLRQLCCHPGLFVEGYDGGSGKLNQLLEIIEECRSSGKRMLIFSQFTSMLERIGRELGFLGIPFFYLDGQTPPSQRISLCSRFNAGEQEIFLISLKAGGTGLNLTGADTVILYDLWWNPAVEQQAADRAHRIGQKKVVQVIRLVAQGTVEDKMFELQQRKKQLIDEVVQPTQDGLSSLTEQDIREILMI